MSTTSLVEIFLISIPCSDSVVVASVTTMSSRRSIALSCVPGWFFKIVCPFDFFNRWNPSSVPWIVLLYCTSTCSLFVNTCGFQYLASRSCGVA